MSIELAIILMSIYVIIASFTAAFFTDQVKDEEPREWGAIVAGWICGIAWPIMLALTLIVSIVLGLQLAFGEKKA